MKLFVNGREMKGHNMFGNYGVQDNSVINSNYFLLGCSSIYVLIL